MLTPFVSYSPHTGPTVFHSSEHSEVYSEWGANAVMTPMYGDNDYTSGGNANPIRSLAFVQTPGYTPGQTSPSYSLPRSPIYRDSEHATATPPGSSPNYSPTHISIYQSSAYSPSHGTAPKITSPVYQPTGLGVNSPTYNRGGHSSPQYSPTNWSTGQPPGFSPTTPAYQTGTSQVQQSIVSGASPIYNPVAPANQTTTGANPTYNSNDEEGESIYVSGNVKTEVKKEEEEEIDYD